MQLVLPLTLLVGSKSSFGIGFEDGLFPELILSGRALGMGNAFISKVDDESAPFYNPAGLGTFRKWSFHLSNLYAEANKDLSQNISQEAGDTATNALKAFNLDEIRKLHLENPGFVAHSRFSVAPNFTTRFFSAGYFYSRRSRSYMGEETDSTFEFADRRDHGPYASLNISSFGGLIKIGAAGMWLFRKEQIGTRSRTAEIENLGPEESKSGRAFLLTTGAKITLPIFALPTFSATMHNTGDVEFSKSSTSEFAPDAIKQNAVLGFSLTPQIGKVTRLHLEVNYRDATEEFDDLKGSDRWAAGIELDIFRTIFFRGGYSNGWGSGGLGIRVRDFRLDLTTYAVDVDTADFEDREDRRFSLGISAGF